MLIHLLNRDLYLNIYIGALCASLVLYLPINAQELVQTASEAPIGFETTACSPSALRAYPWLSASAELEFLNLLSYFSQVKTTRSLMIVVKVGRTECLLFTGIKCLLDLGFASHQRLSLLKALSFWVS